MRIGGKNKMTEHQYLKLLDNLDKDMDWLNANLKRLKEEYDQKFIAVKNNNVVAVGTFMEDVIETLKLQKTTERNWELMKLFITK